MKPITAVGLALILLAILGYATGGFTFQNRRTDIDTGSIHISHPTSQRTLTTFPWRPYLSTISLVAGLGMVISASRSR